MPLLPSGYNFSTGSFFRSPSFETNASASSSSWERLPPQPSTTTRRLTPMRRGWSEVSSVNSDYCNNGGGDARMFQARPLRNLSIVSRSPSPCSSISSMRRIYPQVGNTVSDYGRYGYDDNNDEDRDGGAPVVFDANLTFVLGCQSRLRQNVRPIPAHLERATSSNRLSSKIDGFLKRTDHVMDEWKRFGRHGGKRHDVSMNNTNLDRSKSATNILIKGFQLYSRANSLSRSSVAREPIDDCCTEAEVSELSEMTADLAEEHSTSTLATERLDAETSERIRLERELSEVGHKNKELQQTSERLEMELLYARSDLNGICEEDEDGDGDGGAIYKQRYERAVRELEFTKRRLQQQHEDDLEQLVGLKKQLEKKLMDAYEEVEEQRQVVGQWKRKVQKLTGEMNDLRHLLEEQNGRNNLLEKKQRKFDSETQLLQDELKKERQTKDRLAREKEIVIAEKYALDANLADTRLELELKEDKLSSLQREYDELTCGGKTEEEVTILRRQKIDCERRLHDQDEELDDLAGQVQILEQTKLRLEMSLESQRKEGKKEAQLRDEELDEVRCTAQKKVKALEAQLENEHDERTALLREKHELERRLAEAAECERNDRAGDEALLHRLKRDLKRTKVLLRDAQTQIERQKSDNFGKNAIRQLKNQLEDAECAKNLALKTKQSLEQDLNETQLLLEESNRAKHELEQKAMICGREKSELQSQLEENEEELAEVLKKYKSAVQQTSLDQMALQEQVSLVSELEVERNQLREQLAELTSKLESVESMGDVSSNLLVRRSEMKVKELESRLELEQTTRGRLEVQIARLKETLDKIQSELASARAKEQQALDQSRKLQRNLRETRDELNNIQSKETENCLKRKELEKRCENLEGEAGTARNDLKLAMKRIEDLQSAIAGELDNSISDNSDSDQDSYSSDESMSGFLNSQKSVDGNNDVRPNHSRSSATSSTLGKDSSYA